MIENTQNIANNSVLLNHINYDSTKDSFLKNAKALADKDRIPVSSKVYNKIDQFFDLGSSSLVDVEDMNPEEQEAFLNILAKLLKNGVVGYHYYEFDGKIEKHYIINEIGNRRLNDAKIVKNYIDCYV